MNRTNTLENYNMRPVFEEMQLDRTVLNSLSFNMCTKRGTWMLMDFQSWIAVGFRSLARRRWKDIPLNIFILLLYKHGNAKREDVYVVFL
jgi:hypothetical protein